MPQLPQSIFAIETNGYEVISYKKLRNMNVQKIFECGANVSFTISALDLKEFMVSLIEERSQNSVPIPTERYLTTEETAQKLGCDISTLWRWDKSGYLRKIKIGNKVRYRESDVLKLMEG